MKKIRILFILTLFIVGCSNNSGSIIETESEIQTEYDTSLKSSEDVDTQDGNSSECSIFTDTSGNELSVSVISVSSTDISYVIKNNAQDTVYYGGHRDLYIKTDTTWELVDYRELGENEEYMDNLVLNSLYGEKEIEKGMSFESFYGELSSGHYKLSLGEFYYDKDDSMMIEIEFDIE